MRRRQDNGNGIEYSRRASIALNTLDHADRAEVQRAIELLYQSPDSPYVVRQVKEYTDLPDLYVMKVRGTLRIIFSYSGATLIILDIVRSDRLKKMYGGL